MTPKEARTEIREKIAVLKSAQIAAKKILAMPHGVEHSYVMAHATRRALELSLYHNALNELCGRKLSHNYKEGYRSHYNANEFIKKLRSEIVWPVKTPATA